MFRTSTFLPSTSPVSAHALVAVAIVVCAAALCGAAAGWLGQCLLIRLRRGVRAPVGWCAGIVAVLWGLLALRWMVGTPGPAAVLGWGLTAVPGWWLPVPAALAWFGALLGICDVLALRLPNVLTGLALPTLAGCTGLGSALSGDGAVLRAGCLGAVLCGTVYLGVRMLAPPALGPGDVKLAPSLGMAVGGVSVSAVGMMIAAAAVLTVAGGVFGRGRATAGVPHAPALLVPAWILTALGP